MGKVCYTFLAALGILGSRADRIEQMDHVIHKAFSENSSTIDYANAALILEEFERELRESKAVPDTILEWVDEKADSVGRLYGALQRLKKEYGK